MSSFAAGGGPAFVVVFALLLAVPLFVIPHPEQSRMGEESAFAFALAFPSVIPGEPALSEVEWVICFLFVVLTIFFIKFSPKIACQAPKSLKNLPTNT
ncbi:MAG TPA: hypothetical protein VHW70_05030 [Edaphobacter sp.]|nr:hypothetical protein [Edaphobacter sp.]